MAGPWEKYAPAAPSAPAPPSPETGPWVKYQAPATAPAPAAAPMAPAAAMTAAPAAPVAAPVATEDSSLLDTIMGGLSEAGNLANAGARGVANGVTNILTLPQAMGEGINNLAQWGAEKAGAPQGVIDAAGYINPIGHIWPSAEGVKATGDALNNSVASLFGVEPPRGSQGMAERVTERVGEELGAAALPAVGTVLKYGNRSLQVAKEAPAIARFFGAEAAAVNPAAYLAKEASFATAAGGGAAAANETFGRGPVTDLAGALGGAGLLGVGSSVGRSVTDIGRAFFGNGSYADEVVRDAVMRDLAAGAGVTAAPGDAPDMTAIINATEGPRVADTIPGYQESLADRTKIPGIAAMEYSRQSGPNAGTYTAQRAKNTEAVDAAMAPLAPDPNATPGQFSGALNEQRAAQLDSVAEGTRQATTAYETAVRGLMPAMTGEGRGANIRTALEDASDAAKAVVSEAWAPVNNSTARLNVAPLGESFGQVRADTPEALQPLLPAAGDVPGRLTTPGQPAQPTGILDASGNPIMRPATPPIGEQPLSEIMGIRSALSNELRRQGITPQERRLVDEHIGRLDTYLDQNVPTELRQQYDAARNATRDFSDRFTRPQSAIGQTLAEREGLPRGPDSAVAGKFVQDDQGKIADFEALMRETGTDDRVQTAVRDQILQDVQDRGLMENPQALTDYLGQYGTVFNRFPQLREQLGSAGALRGQMDNAVQTEEQVRTRLTQQGKSNVANYLSYGDEKAEQAMKGVLASRDPAASIDELISFVGDEPKAVEGARKVFWDIMQGKTRAGGRTTADVNGAQPWSPKALSDFLDNPTNAAVAERLYRDNPEHLTNVRNIAEALKGVDTRNAAKAPNSSGTAQGMQSQLLTPEALQSRAYAYMSGRISGTFLVTSIASVLVRRGVRKAQEQGYQRMMDDILTNADTAALMMRKNNPAARQALARKAKGWYGNEASTILNAMSSDDSNEETDAITREAK